MFYRIHSGMDYRQLLIKYMNHVINEESVSFLEGLTLKAFDTGYTDYHQPIGATRDDIAELIAIRDEIQAKRKAEYEAWRVKVQSHRI